MSNVQHRNKTGQRCLGTVRSLILVGTVCFLGLTAASADERKTIISGAIHFYDDEGKIVRPYPWSADAVGAGLKARAVNKFQNSEIRKPLALKSGKQEDELLGMEVAEYTVDTSDTLELPTVVRVSFSADVWHGILELELLKHLGQVDKEHIKVYRISDSGAAQVRKIREVIEGDSRPLDAYREAYQWTIGLTNTSKGDAGRDNTEDFLLLVKLVERMVKEPGAMNQGIAEDLASIDLDRDFAELPALDRYRILSALAYVLARTPNLDQPIYTDYSYYDLARSAFDTAVDIAQAENLLLSRRFATILQERYKMSCEYGLNNQAKFLDCISDLDEFMTSVENLSLRSKTVGLSDFERYLYQVSGIPAGQGLSVAKRREIVCDTDLKSYWALFARTVKNSGSEPLVQSNHLRASHEFASTLGDCQVES